MTREAFRELVKNGPVILDGATGTNLQDAGDAGRTSARNSGS